MSFCYMFIGLVLSGKIHRSWENLRSKYDSLKKEVKKKVNKNKAENLKTGGGVPDYIIFDDMETKLLEILSLSISGLSNKFDSDSVLPKTSKYLQKGEQLIS